MILIGNEEESKSKKKKRRMKKKMHPEGKTRFERLYDCDPYYYIRNQGSEYWGIGAMTESPRDNTSKLEEINNESNNIHKNLDR